LSKLPTPSLWLRWQATRTGRRWLRAGGITKFCGGASPQT